MTHQDMPTKAQAEYQTIIVTLDDGRTGAFTGAVLVRPGDDDNRRVVRTEFTKPRKLPDGCTLEAVSDDAQTPAGA